MPVGGSRFYDGRTPEAGGYAWECKTCGTSHTTPFEKGCPACGTGVPVAAAPAKVETIDVERLKREILNAFWTAEVSGSFTPEQLAALPVLSKAARISIAIALAHYADHGAQPSNEELSRYMARMFGRYLMQQIEAEESAKEKDRGHAAAHTASTASPAAESAADPDARAGE